MKIAIIPGAFFPNPGGAQVQAHNLANKLCETNNQADIVLLNKTNIVKKKYNVIYLNKILINIIFIFHYYLKIDLTFFLETYFKKIISKNKYKIWHFIFINYKSLLFINILKKLNQKIIVTFQGADIQINKNILYGNRLDKNYEKLLKKSIINVDLFTAISKNIFKDLIKIGIKKRKIIIIPNGIPLKKFIELKKKIRLSSFKKTKIKLITVARYAEKKKGFDLIPKIILNFKKLKINYEWTIIGKNTSNIFKNKIIKKQKKNFKIYDNFFLDNESFFPHKKIILKYLKSDLYVNLSRIESFGITFVESLGANTPVITFDTKGANEIVHNNYNGFIIKKNDVNLYCKKIKKFNKNKKIFKNNPIISSKSYDLFMLIKKYKKIYKDLSI